MAIHKKTRRWTRSFGLVMNGARRHSRGKVLPIPMSQARILDGKQLAGQIRAELAERISQGLSQGGNRPGLATILVGADPASQVYVRFKRRACEECGIANFHEELPGDISPQALLAAIQKLNDNSEVHGILLQLPPPQGA